MAITVALDQPAAGFLCAEKPQYIGGARSSIPAIDDFDDCFDQVMIGTHPDGHVVTSGDYLQYQIYPVSTISGTLRGGIDLKFVGGPYLSDRPETDTQGRDAALHDWAPNIGTWKQVTQSLEPFVGMTVDQLIFHVEEDDAGGYVFRYKQIVITNGEEVVKQFFVGQATGLPNEAPAVFRSNIESSTLILASEGGGGTIPGSPTIVSSGTSYAVAASETVIINLSSAGTMTFNLPDVTLLPVGKYYIFTNAHASNNLIIDPFSTQTILTSGGAQSTITLTPGQSLEIIKNGSAWAKIGG